VAKLEDIEGIGAEFAKKLRDAGIDTTDELLKVGSTPQGREGIATSSGISEKLILEWVNHADLFRINGVASEYADLLEAAGVDTVPELAQRNAANLAQKLAEVNEKKKLVRQLPAEAMLAQWIKEAQSLPRVITY
jgi:predicted flap endonuclease-1-like 5' DNA nuclease